MQSHQVKLKKGERLVISCTIENEEDAELEFEDEELADMVFPEQELSLQNEVVRLRTTSTHLRTENVKLRNESDNVSFRLANAMAAVERLGQVEKSRTSFLKDKLEEIRGCFNSNPSDIIRLEEKLKELYEWVTEY